MIWSTKEYEGFAVVKMKVSSSEFWKMTLQEYWLLMLRLVDEIEIRKTEVSDRTWLHADMKAHIANFSMYKKRGGGQWTAEDFIKKPDQENKQKEKLTLKEAKASLGSRFIMNNN